MCESSHARSCRHGCNRQAICLHSDAPTQRARYHGGFATTPRENALRSTARGIRRNGLRICVFNAFLLFEMQQHYAKEGWYFTYVYIELLLRYCV